MPFERHEIRELWLTDFEDVVNSRPRSCGTQRNLVRQLENFVRRGWRCTGRCVTASVEATPNGRHGLCQTWAASSVGRLPLAGSYTLAASSSSGPRPWNEGR